MSAVLNVIEKVGNAAAKVVNKVVDTVVDTVKAAVKDPITTIAKVAAYATGNAWAIPLIDGASTLAKGGNIGEAIKSAAISYGTQAIQVKVGTAVGNAAGSFAASQGATAATQKIVSDIAARAVGNAAVAVVTKQDPVKAFVSGGVSAATSAVLGKVPTLDSMSPGARAALSTAVGAYISGQQNFDEAAASLLVSASGIAGKALASYDPDGTKLTDTQRAFATDAIMKTTTAALAGRSGTAALTQSLTNAATKAISTFASDALKSAGQGMAEGFARINGYGAQLDTIATKSVTATNSFNDVNGSLQAAINEQNRLYKAQQDARTAYDSNVTDANYNAAQNAVKAYNDYTTALNKSYNEYYKPTLDRLSTEVQGYQTEYDKLTGVVNEEQKALKAQIDNVTKALDPVYANSNRAFAETLMPGFDVAAYKALNPNLPKDADPYLHYITTGQFDGLRATQAQLKESTDIINAILINPDVDERALQSYIDSGYLTKDFVASATKKNYNDLVNELDKRVTTEGEAYGFFKKIYGREATSEADRALVQKFTSLAETAAQRSFYATKQIEDDNAEFIYDGSGAKSQNDARAQAESKGYNTFSYGGGTYTILPPGELDQRVALGKKILAAQGKNFVDASDQDITRAMELANRVPQAKLRGASAQDVINGNYSGWREGKYYEYAGDRLQGVYAIDPATGKMSLERVEISGGVSGQAEVPVITITAPRDLSDFAMEDPEAYLQLASKLDKDVQGDLGDFFTNSLNAAMLAAESTGNKNLANNIRQTFSIVTQGVGEQTENLAKFFASVTGGSYDTNLIRAAKALQAWGAANQSANTVAQETAIKDAVKNAKGVGDKIKAFVVAAKDNPGGFFTMVAKEGVQEILPLWAARGVMTLGKVAAYGANAAVESMESWGSSSGQVYNDAIKAGKNDVQAREMALKAGFQSAVITAVTTGVTDIPMVKKILGDGVATSYKDIGKATAASTMGEYVEELFQNANNQRITYGKIDWDYASTAATLAAGTAAGTTGTIMTGLNIRDTAFVAKDANGNNVTLSDFLAGTKQVDMKTLDMNTVVGTSADGDNITLGGVAAMQMSSGVSYDTFKVGLPSVIANQNFVLGTNALGDQVTLSQAMSQVTSTKGFDTVYNNLLNTTAAQRVEAQTDYLKTTLTNAGYKPTDAEIKSLVQTIPPGSAALATAAQQYADTHTVTEAEATKALKDAYTAAGFKDYTPTKEQVASYVQSGASVDQTAVINNIKSYVDENTVTYDEAKAMFALRGYTPTDAEIKKFVATTNQKAQLDAVTQYVDPRQVTYAEAKAMMEKLGYKPSDAEIKQFVGQKEDAAYQAQQETSLGEYVDPRMVDEDEVKAAYEALGLKKPTAADVQKLVGQYAETDLAGKAKENLDPARYNSIMFELENMAKQAGISPEALEAIKSDFNTQFEALGVDVKNLATQVSDVQTSVTSLETNLSKKIEAAARAGADADTALQTGLTSLASELGVTKEALLTQLGTTEEAIRAEVTSQFEAVQTQIADTESRLAQAINDAKTAGLEGDAAIQAAIDTVAADLGTTRTDLLTQLGTTEANLKADFTTRIGDVQTELKSDIGGVKTDVANLSQDVQTKYDALTEGQKDLATQLAQQGLRLSDAIELVRTQTAEAFTNVFDTMATNQATTQKSIEETAAATQAAAAAEAERTRQANARNAANQAKLGNVNTLMQMLGQAKDTGGQQVTVKAADPAKIGYIYDFNSIFANPQQAQMFASPYGAYAQGGTVEDVNDELLKLLRG